MVQVLPLARPIPRSMALLPTNHAPGKGVPANALYINGLPVVINGYYIVIGS